MPFIVQCPYCKVRMRVPERALGGSGKCSRCANFFTLTPADDQNEPELVGAAAGASDPLSSDLEPVATSAPAAAVAEPEPEATLESVLNIDAEIEAHETPADAEAKETEPTAATEDTPTRIGLVIPPWINAAGAAAFILGSIALAAAAFGATRSMTIGLAITGLAVVAVALLTRWHKRRIRDYRWFMASGAVSAAVLATALFRPTVLNRQWGRDFQVAQLDPLQMLLVSRDNRVTGSPVQEADWVDASKHAIRQGDVHVVLEKVVVELPPEKGPGKDKPASLVVTMRLANVGRLQQIVYEPAKGLPTLRDDKGKSYALRTPAPDQVDATGVVEALVSANRHMDELLIWEAPEVGAAFLELAMPAAAWGGKGTFKFRIPSDMYAAKKDAKKR